VTIVPMLTMAVFTMFSFAGLKSVHPDP